MPASPKLANQTHLLVRPWQDATIDAVGHDPRSYYVERFWLPILGPSVVLLLRRAAYAFDVHPEGTAFDLDETARDLGLSYRGG
ncbi:MAG TPA: hypothetical protein VMM13_19640, partial [Euzebya sp.]|nr:hypothetical protein [Euzebya sp.]